MPSPFPGVDPFIEDQHYWPDFHQSFMTYLRDHLLETLPPNYDARLEERVRFVDLSAEEETELTLPDLTVERLRSTPKQASGRGGTATLKPVTIPLPVVEEVREKRVVILHRPGRKLVAVLEVLSPTNKKGDGYEAYVAKRVEVLTHRPLLHLVELDFLVNGRRVPMRKPLPPGDCYAFVSRAEQRPNAEVYAWSIRDPLPTVPIPLRSPDPDMLVDLGGIFRIAYERGRYERSLNYKRPLRVRLAKADLAWAQKLAKARKN